MRKTLLIVLLMFPALPSLSKEVIVQPGDTLSSIANSNNISIRSLMDLNQIYNADKLKVGQILNLPNQENKTLPSKTLFYTVKPGETISGIAIKHDANLQAILTLNNMNNYSIIYPGQIIKLPANKNNLLNSYKKEQVEFYIVKKGDSLISISRKYNIDIQKLIKRNHIKDPNNISPGTKLTLLKTANSDLDTREKVQWKNYGPLQVKWSSWKPMDGSFVAPATNQGSKDLFIAIDCSSSKINATGKNGKWRRWFNPIEDFEFNLLEDVCKEKKKSFN